MTERPVRTRFAPSPTGELHLGNARTAVLNWLWARHCGGAFIVRFEDTDVARHIERSEATILEGLDWLGLDRDEDPRRGGPAGPYRQSERIGLYRRRAEELAERGAAFRCYCTEEELGARQEAAIRAGEPPGLDPRCRALDEQAARALAREGRTPALRLRVDPGPVPFMDRLKGELSFDGADLGDMVLLRADGRPTYNFAVVVDDIAMGITHVIRGVGHLSNTPKQVLLYRALGASPPEFVHIPLVLAPGGGKLSKRAGAPGLLSYRDEGYHPAAVVNYLSLLSWSSPSGEEVLDRERLIAEIDLDRVGSKDAELDLEKMRWLSGQHLRRELPSRAAARLAPFLERAGLRLDEASLVRATEVFRERFQLLSEAADELRPIFEEPAPEGEAKAVLRGREAEAVLRAARDAWEDVAWEPAALKAALGGAGKAAGARGRALYQPVRAALTGALHGPDLADVAYALGRERALRRLERVLGGESAGGASAAVDAGAAPGEDGGRGDGEGGGGRG